MQILDKRWLCYIYWGRDYSHLLPQLHHAAQLHKRNDWDVEVVPVVLLQRLIKGSDYCIVPDKFGLVVDSTRFFHYGKIRI